MDEQDASGAKNSARLSLWARRRIQRAEAMDRETEAMRRRFALELEREEYADAHGAPPAVPDVPVEQSMSAWMRLLIGFVALVVLAVAGVIMIVIVGTQVAFYRAQMKTPEVSFEKLGIHQTLDLPTFTPIATEGVVWACTLMAVVLVLMNRTSGIWTRAMWLFAGIATFVNTFHAVVADGDVFGGVVKGGLSIAGPFVVHLFILWVRHVRTGKTLAEARLDVTIRWRALSDVLMFTLLTVGDHVAHPIIAVRTVGIWRGYRGISYSEAWHIASKPWRDKIQGKYAISDPTPPARRSPVRERAERSVKPAAPKPAVERPAVAAEPEQAVAATKTPSSNLRELPAPGTPTKKELGTRHAVALLREGRSIESITAAELDRATESNGYFKKHMDEVRAEALGRHHETGHAVGE